MDKSNKHVKTTSIDRGQKIKTSYSNTEDGNLGLKDAMGGKMGGSTTNLAHSLSGSSAVQK